MTKDLFSAQLGLSSSHVRSSSEASSAMANRVPHIAVREIEDKISNSDSEERVVSDGADIEAVADLSEDSDVSVQTDQL
jgi:hypothetical protein